MMSVHHPQWIASMHAIQNVQILYKGECVCIYGYKLCLPYTHQVTYVQKIQYYCNDVFDLCLSAIRSNLAGRTIVTGA